MAHPGINAFEFLVETVIHHHRRVRRIVGDVTKKRLIPMLLDEAQRMIGEIVNHITLAADSSAVVVQWWTEVVAPMAGGEAVEFVEAAIIRVIRCLCAIVPLSKSARGVTGLLENIGDRGLTRIQTAFTATNTPDARAQMISAGKKLGSCWRADCTDIKVFK